MKHVYFWSAYFFLLTDTMVATQVFHELGLLYAGFVGIVSVLFLNKWKEMK